MLNLYFLTLVIIYDNKFLPRRFILLPSFNNSLSSKILSLLSIFDNSHPKTTTIIETMQLLKNNTFKLILPLTIFSIIKLFE